MNRNSPFVVLGVWLALALPLANPAQAADATGAITGRVLNEATGQYLRSAIVTVVGTNISTVAESGGVYMLSRVPAGEARVAVSFLGLDTAEAIVKVSPRQTVVHDFTMRSAATDRSDVVKLDVFRVVTEREGNYKAIQEQKSALEIKSVISSDAFGDVSEGNVGEFLKLMPGIMTDHVGADVRSVSIGGLDPKYAVILMDGAPVSSSGGSSNEVGRTFEFEQLSISSIETVEVSKTPTPDVAGSALAGVVNLRSKGAFDRKGRQIRWSTSAGLNSRQKLEKTPGPMGSHTLKLQPNASLEFSDVFFDSKLGVLAGLNFSRTFSENNIMSVGHRFDGNPANNATEVPGVGTLTLNDAPKTTARANYNLRLDYKFTPELTAWVRADYNTYKALIGGRIVTLRFNNAVNGPLASDPQIPGVEYSLESQTSTSATSQLNLSTGFNKHGATTTLASGGAFKRGAFRADVQAQMSRSTNFYHDVDYGFFDGGSTAQLTNLGLRWNRSSPHSTAIDVTQVSGADWRNPANYTGAANPTAKLLPFNSKDQQWTAKADFRYNWSRGEIPVLFKWGGGITQAIRDVNSANSFTYTYFGPDGVAGTGDEGWFFESNFQFRNLAGGNLQNLPTLDRYAMAREFGAHPERFAQPTAQNLLLSRLRTHFDVKEQIDSVYQQTIINLTKKFTLAPGVRMEKTRGSGRGPVDRGDDYAKRVLTGDPNANIPTTSLDYIQARYGSNASNDSDYHTWLKYLHATYRWNSELIFRASFNDSITRPNHNNLAGGMTINPDAVPPTATIANPGLVPEHGRNFFASAEYYFPKGAGFLTVSGARRDITNLIRSSFFDVPFGEDFRGQDLDLGGYRVTTSDNVGKAHVTSGEASYRQNLVFLPGLWKGVSIFGNYTRLHFDHYENFRRPKNLANAGVSFDHRGLSLRWNVVYVPQFRRGAVPANGWRFFDAERVWHDVQFAYRVSKYATVFGSGRNIFNQQRNRLFQNGSNKFINQSEELGVIWMVGVRGQF